MTCVQFATGVLLISAKQKFVKQLLLLKQLYEVGRWPWASSRLSILSPDNEILFPLSCDEATKHRYMYKHNATVHCLTHPYHVD